MIRVSVRMDNLGPNALYRLGNHSMPASRDDSCRPDTPCAVIKATVRIVIELFDDENQRGGNTPVCLLLISEA